MSECPPTHPQSDFFFKFLGTINASDVILSIFFFLLLFFGLFLVSALSWPCCLLVEECLSPG